MKVIINHKLNHIKIKDIIDSTQFANFEYAFNKLQDFRTNGHVDIDQIINIKILRNIWQSMIILVQYMAQETGVITDYITTPLQLCSNQLHMT